LDAISIFIFQTGGLSTQNFAELIHHISALALANTMLLVVAIQAK